MKYGRLIFGGKVLNYERHLTYFQFLIYKKIIESSLKDLNYICVTKLTQEQAKKIWMDEKLFSLSIAEIFFIHGFRFSISARFRVNIIVKDISIFFHKFDLTCQHIYYICISKLATTFLLEVWLEIAHHGVPSLDFTKVVYILLV